VTPMNRSTAPFLDAPHDERAGHASNYTESDLRAFDALNLFSSDKIKSTTGSSKSTLNNSTIDYTETDLAEFEKLNLAAKQNGSGTSYSLAAEDTEYKIGFFGSADNERIYSANDLMLFKKIYEIDDKTKIESSSMSSPVRTSVQASGDQYSSHDIAAFESLMNFQTGNNVSFEASPRIPSFLTETLNDPQERSDPEYSMKIIDSDRERLKQRASLGHRLHSMKIVFTPHKRMK